MAEPALHGREDAAQESLGDLVALAVSDISQLVRYEVDLAKIELKADARRVGIGGALFGAAAFAGCVVLALLSFAFAYGFSYFTGWPVYSGFLAAAFLTTVLAVLAVFIGKTRFQGLSGLRKTRTTVSGDIAMIRRDDSESPDGSAGVR